LNYFSVPLPSAGEGRHHEADVLRRAVAAAAVPLWSISVAVFVQRAQSGWRIGNFCLIDDAIVIGIKRRYNWRRRTTATRPVRPTQPGPGPRPAPAPGGGGCCSFPAGSLEKAVCAVIIQAEKPAPSALSSVGTVFILFVFRFLFMFGSTNPAKLFAGAIVRPVSVFRNAMSACLSAGLKGTPPSDVWPDWIERRGSLDAGGVMIDHFLECLKPSVMHVGRGEFNVPERGHGKLAAIPADGSRRSGRGR